jgi:superfamily I DNA and/or RNA helicase
VRSNPRFLEEDARKGLGFMFERKRYGSLNSYFFRQKVLRIVLIRMNVAITRAKELLVVIGNGALLQRDPYWKAFLAFTIRNKL